MKRVLGALVLFCSLISAQAAVTGRVVDATGAPVGDAMITYTDIANRLNYVYTCGDGKFSIPAPADWSLDNLSMYSTGACMPNAVRNPAQAQAGSGFGISVKSGLLSFRVRENASKVSVTVFNLSGRAVARPCDKQLDAGRYSVNLFTKATALRSHQVYVVRVSDGKATATLKLTNAGNAVAISHVNDAVDPAANTAILQKVAAVDGLRAGKTGYAAKTIDLTAYTGDVGDIAIKKIDIEARVDSLFKLMTQDEKVGQVMQVAGCDSAHAAKYGLGAFQKGEGNQGPMKGALSTRLKIPIIGGNDWVHGGRHVYFPHNIGMGCTRDPLLVELAYRIYSLNCLPLYNNEDFAPCLDEHRNDYSGRVYEGFSEGPEVVSIMARASVRGIQGTDLASGYTMMATLKHWAYAGGTAAGATKGNTAGSLTTLSKIHAPPFIVGVKEGAAGVMTGYQQINGDTMSLNKAIVTDTLKGSYGFDGFVITDWGTAAGVEVRSIASGHDLLMCVDTPKLTSIYASLKSAAGTAALPQARLDDAVKRVLRAKFRMGLFENPWPNPALNTLCADQKYRDVARACVRKSIVLLKNDNAALPIGKAKNVYVVGTWADNMGYQCGGWSATNSNKVGNSNVLSSGDEGWQGTATAHGITGATTIYQAIQKVCTGTVTYSATAGTIPPNTDVIVAVIGEVNYAEFMGDIGPNNAIKSLAISAAQQTLIQTLAASKIPVVTILISGRPMVLGTVGTNSNALIAAWLPGTEGAGITDVIFGDVNFTGKLAHSWPATIAQEPINYGAMGDATGKDVTAPLYDFGYGLKY